MTEQEEIASLKLNIEALKKQNEMLEDLCHNYCIELSRVQDEAASQMSIHEAIKKLGLACAFKGVPAPTSVLLGTRAYQHYQHEVSLLANAGHGSVIRLGDTGRERMMGDPFAMMNMVQVCGYITRVLVDIGDRNGQ